MDRIYFHFSHSHIKPVFLMLALFSDHLHSRFIESKMEDIYHFNHDCIHELSRILTDDTILLSLSCSSKSTRSCFFSRDYFICNNNYTNDQISMFTHVKELNLRDKIIDLNSFRYLERLICGGPIRELNLHDYSKLTYFYDFRSMQCIHFAKLIYLKYLNCYFGNNIENFIYLQSLRCHIKASPLFDLSLLFHLTNLDLECEIQKESTHQKVNLSSAIKLIRLSAVSIDFSKISLMGDKLTWLDLYKSMNISFSNLIRIRVLLLSPSQNINIFDDGRSFQYLTHLDTDNNTSINFHHLTNLKFLEIKKVDSNVNLSCLTSLEILTFKHTISNNIDLTSLINLKHLNFTNYANINSQINLPKNITYLCFEQKKPKKVVCTYEWNTREQIYNILKQVENMSNLQKLELIHISLSDKINNSSLTKLILSKCEFKPCYNFVNVKRIVLEEVNGKEIDMKYLSGLKKLTLKNCSGFTETHFDELKSLENLKLKNFASPINFNNIATLTQFGLYEFSRNIRIRKLKNLKCLKTDNIDLFFELCKYKLPRSVKDVYIKAGSKYLGDIMKFEMKGVNLHWI